MIKDIYKFFIVSVFIIIGCVGPIINTPKVVPEEKANVGIGLSYMFIPKTTFKTTYYDKVEKVYKEKDTTVYNQSYAGPAISLGIGAMENVELGIEFYGLFSTYLKGKCQITKKPLLSSITLGVGFPSAYIGGAIGGYVGNILPYLGANLIIWYYGFEKQGITAPIYPSGFGGINISPAKAINLILQVSYFPSFTVLPITDAGEMELGKGPSVGINVALSFELEEKRAKQVLDVLNIFKKLID